MNAWPNVIALGLSGGGYRAAAFHLGALRALDDLDLLERVRWLSTASGGTILGASWLKGRACDDEKFADFERRAKMLLADENVVKLAAEAMTKQSEPSLIRAAAEIYDDAFLGGKDLKLGALAGVIDEVRFNATEMDTGNSFRFAIGNSDAKIGNQRRFLDPAVRDRVRVADVVAASACFPGAFEPIVFPDDFAGDDLVVQSNDDHFSGALALMDGGIYDNQAIDALVKLYEQTSIEVKPDLVIACDVDNGAEPIFAARAAALPALLDVPLKVRHVVLAADVASLVAVGLSLFGTTAAFFDQRWAVIPLGASALLALILALAWVVGRRKVSSSVTKMLPFRWDGWPTALGSLSLAGLVRIVERRLGSLIALTARVFMKRVRELTFGAAKAALDAPGIDVSGPHMIDGSDGMHLGFALLLRRRGLAAGTPRLVADAAMLAVRNAAAKQPTTLWFADDRDLERVWLAGRMAALEALDVFLGDDDKRVHAAWNALAADCRAQK
jgi:predicted acylesterase/phospholipase RssA